MACSNGSRYNNLPMCQVLLEQNNNLRLFHYAVQNLKGISALTNKRSDLAKTMQRLGDGLEQEVICL